MVFIPNSKNGGEAFKPTAEQKRQLIEECMERNINMLAIIQVKFSHMIIPPEILRTLSFTTFATALDIMLRWMPDSLAGNENKAFHDALDGFVAVAIKGASDELALEQKENKGEEGNWSQN